MKKCPFCNKPVEEEAKNCGYCRASVSDSKTDKEKKEVKGAKNNGT